jgi:S-DNA-T family DNA segregation ATPase FtsK/SpoIIIE
VVSPIILLATMVAVVMFVARRVWRYALCMTSTVILAGPGVGCSWVACAELTAGLVGLGGLWAWQHPASFARIVVGQLRSEWRRALVYAWPWKRVMLFSELTKRTGQGLRRVHYPRMRRVRSDG